MSSTNRMERLIDCTLSSKPGNIYIFLLFLYFPLSLSSSVSSFLSLSPFFTLSLSFTLSLFLCLSLPISLSLQDPGLVFEIRSDELQELKYKAPLKLDFFQFFLTEVITQYRHMIYIDYYGERWFSLRLNQVDPDPGCFSMVDSRSVYMEGRIRIVFFFLARRIHPVFVWRSDPGQILPDPQPWFSVC